MGCSHWKNKSGYNLKHALNLFWLTQIAFVMKSLSKPFQGSSINPIQDGFFGAAHGWGGLFATSPPP